MVVTHTMARRMWPCALLAAALAAGFAGCERQAPAPAPATAPAGTAPPATQAADRTQVPAPAATQPTVSFMRINDHLVEFPRARLKLEDEGSRLTALLFSDDPREAIKDDYTGNSFYIQMVLDIADPKDLPTATWQYRSRSSDREDSPYGIFLSGRKIVLQPYQVTATFTPEDPTTVTLAGHFLLWNDAEDAKLPQVVPVTAQFTTRIEKQKQ